MSIIAKIIVAAIASFILVTVAGVVRDWPVPRCGDHEIVTGHCIPYCPPNPKECG